jgi:5-azacytidine-induced protein 1
LGLAEDALALHSRVSLLDLEVNDKKEIIGTLKKAVAEAKEREKQSVQQATKDFEEKMQQQRAHFESQLERQLQLVDRLLNDKTELTKRCELFSEELKAVERKFHMKTEELEEQASKNLARQKQNWMAAEKLRRESWEKDKTREIKEITIKGLQPEVERILAERKQEKFKLDERHKEMLETQRRELLELAQTQVREARDALAKEHEHHLDQEREAHRHKLREEFDKFSSQLQEERAKCAADLLAERRKHEHTLQQETESFEARVREAIAAERCKADAALQGAKASALDTDERHRNELVQFQERLRVEKEQWQQEYTERMQADAERREATLREELTKERDRQLEVLVDRMGREHVEQQRNLKAEHSASVDRVRSESTEQLRRLSEQLEEARVHSSTIETQRALLEQSVNHLESKLEAEGHRVAETVSRVQHLENELSIVQKSADKAAESHKDELWRAAQGREKDAEASKRELSELNACILKERSRAEQLQVEAKQREEKIIGDLEARVKRTLQAKDDTIGELRTRCAASDNKARELEYMLARQREELLSGITKDILS